MKYLDLKNIFKMIINYYRDFYNIKSFDEKARERILNYIINCILKRLISKLKKSIFIKKIKIIIRKAILKSSLKKDYFLNKYYKIFIKYREAKNSISIII